MPSTDAGSRRAAIIIIVLALVLGAPIMWWFSNLTDEIKTLAETDRDAAIALFRARMVPLLVGLVVIGMALGAVLVRQGARLKQERTTRLAGGFLIATGVLSAAIPVTLLAFTMWALSRV
jgi:hypothetical protein